MSPRVSIGLPVYNGEHFLAETLQSLRVQTYEDLEIIIADNASTDRTREICEPAAAEDGRIRYFRHEANLGAPANYNFTVAEAVGEYLMWNAHDDLRAPSFVERGLEVFADRPDTAVVFSQVLEIDAEGELLGDRVRHDDLLEDAVHRRFRAAISSPHPSIVVFGLMRLSTMRSTGQHGTYFGADRVLAAELALRGPFAEIPEPLFFSRDHPQRYVRMANERNQNEPSLKQLWWDPAQRKLDRFPRWRRYADYARAVWDHPLSTADRVRCLGGLVASLSDNGFASAKILMRELAEAAVSVLPSPRRTSP